MRSLRTRPWFMTAGIGTIAWLFGCSNATSSAGNAGGQTTVTSSGGVSAGAGTAGSSADAGGTTAIGGSRSSGGAPNGMGGSAAVGGAAGTATTSGGASAAGNSAGGTPTDGGTGGSSVTFPSLGNLVMTRDDARAMTDVVDSTGGYLYVTDASGTEWTLDIPDQPGFDPITVTLTPLSQIDSGAGLALSGGVLFEPEGLVFSEPATLTITPPAGAPAPMPYDFETDGSGLWFANIVKGEVVVSHFSGVAVGPTTLDDLCVKALGGYQGATTAAQQLTGEVQIPSPPSITLQCLQNQEATRKLVSRWVRSVMEPEFTAIGRILGVERAGALAGCSGFDGTPDIPSALLTRLDQKIDLLIALPKAPETTPAIVWAELAIERNLELIGHSARQAAVFADAGARCDQGTTELLRRLREEHDYAITGAILNFARTTQLVTDVDSTSVLDAIIAAYRFQVDLDVTMQESYPGYAEGPGDEYWGEQASAHMRGSGTFGYTDAISLTSTVLLPNQITMKTDTYTDNQTPRPSYDDYGTCELATSGSYSPSFKLSFDACNASATYVSMNRIGSEQEDTCNMQYIYPEEPSENTSGTYPCGTESMAMTEFAQYYSTNSLTGSRYLFQPLSITNRQAIAIRADIQTVVPSPTNGNGTFSITVTHTPK